MLLLFACLWDNRAIDHHYVRQDWPTRTNYAPAKQNVTSALLMKAQDIFLPPLHIKLGLIKNFFIAVNHEEPATQKIRLFPKFFYAEINEGVIVVSDIRKLMADGNFTKCLTPAEAAAWASFQNVRNFLSNRKSPDYKQIMPKIIARLELKCLSNFIFCIHVSIFSQKTLAIRATTKESVYTKIWRKSKDDT